jgi:predicted site-specific integrase-resolvase
MQINNDHLLLPSVAAQILGVSVKTLHLYVDAGLFTQITTAGGHARFRLSEVNALLAKLTKEIQ